MASTDALFSVRVLADAPSPWAQAAPVITVVLGAILAFLGNKLLDYLKDRRETRQLAFSIATEVRAGRMVMAFLQAHGLGDEAAREDTIRFVKMPDAIMPITTEAAKRVGRFPGPVALAIASQLTVMSTFKQQIETTRNMQDAGVLDDEKFKVRSALVTPLARLLAQHAGYLEDRIVEHYGAVPGLEEFSAVSSEATNGAD